MSGRNDRAAPHRDATAELALVEIEDLGEIGAATLHPTVRRTVAPVARAEIERNPQPWAGANQERAGTLVVHNGVESGPARHRNVRCGPQ